jgi:hypothetical protein
MKWEIYHEVGISSAILRGCEESLEAGGCHFKTCLKWGNLKGRVKIYSKFLAYVGFLCYDVSSQLAHSKAW